MSTLVAAASGCQRTGIGTLGRNAALDPRWMCAS